MKPLAICIIIVTVIILFILFWVHDKLPGLLKDQSTAEPNKKPYSLSRTLLFLWTLLCIFGLCYVGIKTGELPKIDSSTLILMGIAAGTSLAGRSIDNLQANNAQFKRIQDSETEDFLADILSDANGISVSRFQTLCFNLIYACIFISTVFTKLQFYHFDETTLTLLGISSGAYAMLKIPEGQPKP